MYSLSSLVEAADCVSCILLFIISEENEISFETLSAISSFQIEPHHVVFLAGRRLHRLITDLLVETYVTKDTRTGIWRLKDTIRGVSLPELNIQGERSKIRSFQSLQVFFIIDAQKDRICNAKIYFSVTFCSDGLAAVRTYWQSSHGNRKAGWPYVWAFLFVAACLCS